MALYERRASIQYGGHIQLPATTNSTALQLHTLYRLQSLQSLQFEYNPVEWIQPCGYKYNLKDALWTPDFAVSLLF